MGSQKHACRDFEAKTPKRPYKRKTQKVSPLCHVLDQEKLGTRGEARRIRLRCCEVHEGEGLPLPGDAIVSPRLEAAVDPKTDRQAWLGEALIQQRKTLRTRLA